MKSLLILFTLFGVFTTKEWAPNEVGERACKMIEADSNLHEKCTVANMNLGDGYRCCYVEGNGCQYFPDDADEIKKKTNAQFSSAKVDCSSSKFYYNVFFGFVVTAMIL